MTKKLPKCPNCGKCCVNYRKGWACAKKDAISNPIYLRLRKSKKVTTIERGWIHVHAGIPYSKLFGTKKECLKDIAYKANNNPLSRARRATIKTIKTWE
jgi:hypothetical protein